MTSILSNLNIFHSLEVVDRVSETQLQVGDKFILAVKVLIFRYTVKTIDNYIRAFVNRIRIRLQLCEQMKWNESGFRPLLCTYRLNWARRTSWGWWDDWDDTVLQTQDSKLEPWRSEAEHATSRSQRLPTILTFTRGWEEKFLVSFKPPRPGTESRTLAWNAAVLTTTLGPLPYANKRGSYMEPSLIFMEL